MKEKHKQYYMDIAIRTAELSYAKRKKVGAILVKDHNILSFGYNGTPHGFDNCCEESEVTKEEVVHAEMNIFAKCARQGTSCRDATLFITMSPCWECAKLIIQSQIKEVIYLEEYRVTDSIDFIKKAGIKISKFKSKGKE